MTLGHKLRSLYAVNHYGLWITWATLGRELRGLAAMNRSILWLT